MQIINYFQQLDTVKIIIEQENAYPNHKFIVVATLRMVGNR